MNQLREALAGYIREKYGVELAIVLERPPKIEMGEAASPACFELAKRLKRAPRQIAQEIANGLGKVEGIARVEVAGGGYLNAYFDRGAFWEGATQEGIMERNAAVLGKTRPTQRNCPRTRRDRSKKVKAKMLRWRKLWRMRLWDVTCGRWRGWGSVMNCWRERVRSCICTFGMRHLRC